MGLIADDWTLLQVAPNIVILLGFAAVFFGLAVWRFKFES
jgi:ABC-type transport system involved in multi-copper enzyme maturation permease subunit